jgi:hypothetical protein
MAVLAACLLVAPAAADAVRTCRGTSFESGTLDGLTVVSGWAQVEGGVRVDGCHSLRLNAGRTTVGREIPGAKSLDIAFAYRSQRIATRPLLTLPANRIRLVDDGHGHVVAHRGAHVRARLARRSGRAGWARVHVKLTRAQLSIEVDGRIAHSRPRSVAEQRFLLGGAASPRAGALYLDGYSLAAPGATLAPPSSGIGGGSPLSVPNPSAAQQLPAAGAPGAGSDASPDLLPRPFAADSFWNAPLPADARLDPASGALVGELRQQLGVGAPWINTTSYSTPVYQVPADQPTVRVTLDANVPSLQQMWQAVPIPPNAKPANGTDKSMVVWQAATDTMWEFWSMQRSGDTWHARWGGQMTSLSQSPGYYAGAQSGWGVTGSGLPLLGGLITLGDLSRGHIDHALAMSIPQARKGWWTWPASRTDGNMDAPTAIPEGARFRLDPTLDLNRLHLYPLVRMLAQAAQRYGIVIKDQSGVVAFAGEDPTPTGTNPWSGPSGWFSGQYPSTLVQQFPWDHLQALQTNQRNR